MRPGSDYRAAKKARARGVPSSKLLKWERRKRNISRRQLDRERGYKINPMQEMEFTTSDHLTIYKRVPSPPGGLKAYGSEGR